MSWMQHRRVLVDWISEAGVAFNLDRTTIHVAVRISFLCDEIGRPSAVFFSVSPASHPAFAPLHP
jgi:hypothetical protein